MSRSSVRRSIAVTLYATLASFAAPGHASDAAASPESVAQFLAGVRDFAGGKLTPGPAYDPASAGSPVRDAPAGAALSRQLLEEDDAALEIWADRLGALRRGVLHLDALQDCPRAVVRRLLHRWLLAVEVETDLSRQGFEQLLKAVEQGEPTRFSLGRASFAVIREGKLALRFR